MIRSEIEIVCAATVGAVGAFIVTAVALQSWEFAIFAGVGGAVVTAIAAAIRAERTAR